MSEDAPAENAEHTQTMDPVVWKDVSAEEFDNDPVLENDVSTILHAHREFEDPLKILTKTVEVTKDETNFLSPEFQPLHYLTEAHKESSFDQLKQGLTNISETVKDDQSTIKTLVHDNFGAFVNARTTIKTLNNILDNKSALSNSELSLTKPVNDLASIAQTMIEPLQQQRKELHRLEEINQLYDRSIASYNNTTELYEHINNHEYDKALKEYNKLKNVRIEDESLKHCIGTDIEIAITKMKQQLYKQLSLPNLPIHVSGPLMNYLLQLDSTECSEFYAVEVNQKNWEERMEVIESEFVKDLALQEIDLQNYNESQYISLKNLIFKYIQLYNQCVKDELYVLYGITDHYFENKDKYTIVDKDIAKEITLIITNIVKKYIEVIHKYIMYGYLKPKDEEKQEEASKDIEVSNNQFFRGYYIYTQEEVLSLIQSVFIDMSNFVKDGFKVPKLVKPFSEKNLDILTMIIANTIAVLQNQLVTIYVNMSFTKLYDELKTYNGKDLLFSSSFSKYNFYNKIFILLNKIDEIYKVIEKLKNNYIDNVRAYYSSCHLNIFIYLINRITAYASSLQTNKDDIRLYLSVAYTYKFCRESILTESIKQYKLCYENKYDSLMYTCEKNENKYLNIYIKYKVLFNTHLFKNMLLSDDWSSYHTLTMPRSEILDIILQLSVVVGDLQQYVHATVISQWKIPILVRIIEESVYEVEPLMDGIQSLTDDGYMQLFTELNLLRRSLESLPCYQIIDLLLNKLNAIHPMSLDDQQYKLIDNNIESAKNKMKHILNTLN